MATSWTLLETQKLKDSDPIINANLDSIRTLFASANGPDFANFVGGATGQEERAGTPWFDTSNSALYIHNGTNFQKLADMTRVYGDLLPRGDADIYPLRSSLNMGNNRITTLANPTGDQDGANKQWVRDTMIDGHTHDGSGTPGTGVQVIWSDLDSDTPSNTGLIGLVSGTSTPISKHIAAVEDWAGVSVGTSMTDIVTTGQLTINANEPKFINYGFRMTYDVLAGGYFWYEIVLDGLSDVYAITERAIVPDTNTNNSISGAVTVTVTTAGLYDVKLRGKTNGTSHLIDRASLFVI